jgi:flagellar protein FliS
MANTIHDQYVEAEILGADPVKLVGILYRAAIESVTAARSHLQNGEIRERSRKITRASEILNQLMLSLDHSSGGDISRNLVELYAYMQTRLIEANTQQTGAPLAEVESLLKVLSEAWHAAAPAPSAEAAEPAAEYVPLSCTY